MKNCPCPTCKMENKLERIKTIIENWDKFKASDVAALREIQIIIGE